MTTRNIIPRKEITHRRSVVARYLSSNVTDPSQISILMEKDFPTITQKTIANDIRTIMKSEAGQWINDLAMFGYAYLCKRASDKLVEMEEQIETQRTAALKNNDLTLWRLLTTEKRNLIKEQVETIGNGPTLMKLRELMESTSNR